MKNNLETEFMLDSIRQGYEDEKNPLFVWEAFKICMDESLYIPDWVFRYFNEVAGKLLELPRKYKTVSSDERSADEICGILGLSTKKGSRPVYEKYRIYERNREIISRISRRVFKQTESGMREVEKVTDAIEAVSKEVNLSFEAVREIYYDYVNNGKFIGKKTKKKKRKRKIKEEESR
jgi:hypothetical protein